MTTVTIKSLRDALDCFLSIRRVFVALKGQAYLEYDVQKLVEEYFNFESLPKGKIKLIGKISPYIPSPQLPVYTAFDTKNVAVTEGIDPDTGRGIGSISLKTAALNVPAVSLNPITLQDGTHARILWLYPVETKGLIFESLGGKLDENNLSQLFRVNSSHKPIPLLVDLDITLDEFFYRTVAVKGTVKIAPIDGFEAITNRIIPFSLDFYSNCFRPFSKEDGMLAIDLRKPVGEITALDSQPTSFDIMYTVQGMVDTFGKIPDGISPSYLYASLVDFIPDRRGLPKEVSRFSHAGSSSSTILTVGDISWQSSADNHMYASYISLNVANKAEMQAKLAKLAAHWHSWQKASIASLQTRFGLPADIKTFISSNRNQSNIFDINGFSIGSDIQKKLLDENPLVREGIDWLGISFGKSNLL